MKGDFWLRGKGDFWLMVNGLLFMVFNRKLTAKRGRQSKGLKTQ